MNNLSSRLKPIRQQLEHRAQLRPRGAERFFKTDPGQYSSHDLFIGVKIPDLRSLIKPYQDLSFDELSCLIQSPFNEERLLVLLILVHAYQKNLHNPSQEQIHNFYCTFIDYVNNWNLVDASAPVLIGSYCLRNKSWGQLMQFIQTDSLWIKRIAIVSTLAFIKADIFEPTLTLSTALLNEPHDLLHKATGWMLRELGKRNKNRLDEYLKQYASRLPRTALRYALEKHSHQERQYFMRLRKNEFF